MDAIGQGLFDIRGLRGTRDQQGVGRHAAGPVFRLDQLGEVLEQASSIEQGDMQGWDQRQETRFIGVRPEYQAAALRQSGQAAGDAEIDLAEEALLPGFDGPVVVAKGPKGKEVEAIILPLIKKLRANGTFEKIMAPLLHETFIEWKD